MTADGQELNGFCLEGFNTVLNYEAEQLTVDQIVKDSPSEDRTEEELTVYLSELEYHTLLKEAEERWQERFDEQKKYWRYGWTIVSCFILLNLVVITTCLLIQLSQL